MKLLGFKLVDSPPGDFNCHWRGPHGCVVEMDAGDSHDLESAISAIVYAAQLQTKGEMQKAFRNLAGIRQS